MESVGGLDTQAPETCVWCVCRQAEEFRMPDCRNCDGFVTEQYVRVFAPTGMDNVRVCPNCEDKLRDEAEVREAHSPRHTNA